MAEASPGRAPFLTGAAEASREVPSRAEAGRRAWLPVALGAVGVWLATRVAYAAFTYFAVVLGQPGAHQARSLLDAWDQYDTNWYLLISRAGYVDTHTSAFFPLYPGLVGAVTALLGHAHGPVWPAYDGLRLAVALAIANVATLAGFVGLALLAAHEHPDDAAPSLATMAAAAFPFAFFLAAAYTEGAFLAEAAFTLYFARRGAWKRAAAVAFAAGLTRPTAVVLVLPLAWEYGRRRGWWTRRETRGSRPALPALLEALIVAGAVPAAIALYSAFLWWRFGTPLTWLKAEAEVWHREPAPVWVTAARLAHRVVAFPPFGVDEAQVLLNLLPLLLCLLAILVSWRQMPFAFILYTLGLCFLSLSSPISDRPELIESTGRFLTAAIPVFLVLARWMKRWPAAGQAWVSAGFLLQGTLLAGFFAGRWVG